MLCSERLYEGRQERDRYRVRLEEGKCGSEEKKEKKEEKKKKEGNSSQLSNIVFDSFVPETRRVRSFCSFLFFFQVHKSPESHLNTKQRAELIGVSKGQAGPWGS